VLQISWSRTRMTSQARLASLSIFNALDAGELVSLAERVQWVSIAGGTTLFSEGDPGKEMFVVLSGCLGVFRRNVDEHLELLAQIESGAPVGEMALLSNEPRSATIIALRDTELICLSKLVFEDLVSRSPKMMRAIAGIVAMRLRNEMQCRAARSPDYVNAKQRGEHGIFCRTGEYWTIVYKEEESLIKDGKGLHYISNLLRRPGTDIHALELFAMGEPGRSLNGPAPLALEPAAYEEVLPQLTSDGIRCSHLGDAGAMLDLRAKAAYRRRLTELREELIEAKQRGDEDRGTRAEDEIAALTRELRRAVGLGGRDRRAACPAERARVNVTRTIKLALEHIAQSSPIIGSHLKGRIKTGTFCCYRPDPDLPIQWQL
jgi:CRP-like cAMP-binding protein